MDPKIREIQRCCLAALPAIPRSCPNPTRLCGTKKSSCRALQLTGMTICEPDLPDLCLTGSAGRRGLIRSRGGAHHVNIRKKTMFWLSAEWGSSVFGGGLIRGSSCARRPKLSAKRICRIYVLTDLIDGICQIAACRALDQVFHDALPAWLGRRSVGTNPSVTDRDRGDLTGSVHAADRSAGSMSHRIGRPAGGTDRAAPIGADRPASTAGDPVCSRARVPAWLPLYPLRDCARLSGARSPADS